MADYRYTAIDRSGKEVTGTLSCRDATDAAAKVRSLGYFPVEIKSSGGGNGAARAVVGISGGLTRPVIESRARDTSDRPVKPTGKRVKRIQILLFTREMADLIEAGLPIDRALSVLIEQTDNEALREMVQTLQGDIRAGKPLSEALQRYPREFPSLYANMIHAGEVSGQLPAVLTRLADFMEKEQVRKSQIVSAMIYPMVLITVALLAVSVLLFFVIPRLQGVFDDMKVTLPLSTRILLGASDFVMHYWWAIGGSILGSIFLFRAWTNTPSGLRAFDGFRMALPLIGGLTRKITMARYVRTLGTLLGGGVPILDSLEIAGSAVGNSVTSDAIEVVRDGVRQGETLSESMEKTKGFLPLVVHMTAVGEETGRLPQMLGRTANTLDFEVDNTMRRLTSLVEPLVVLCMGGFVGFIVLSILLPIFQTTAMVK